MNKSIGISSALLVATLTAPAGAVELQGALGVNAYGSTWSGDFGGGTLLQLGVRFANVVALDFQGSESLARVDTRVNTGVTFGVAGYLPRAGVRPYARVFGIHQHEEGLVSVEASPWTTALGIGAGIRHRVGAGLALGAAIPVARKDDKFTWVLTPRLTATWLPDPLGPRWYFGAEAAFGFDMVL